MKKQLTRSSSTSFAFAQDRLYRQGDKWVRQVLGPNQMAIPKVKDFWKNYIEGSWNLTVPFVGVNHPFGTSETILDAKPDKPLFEVDVYRRRFGTKNEDFWERVKAGHVVGQDDYFVSDTIALIKRKHKISREYLNGSSYHNDLIEYPLGPTGFTLLECDLGLVPTKVFDGSPYIMTLVRTDKITSIVDGVTGPEDYGYDLSRKFDFIEYLSSRDVDCEFYTEVLAEANAATFDLLTELAELPKTLRYILGRIKQFSQLMIEYQEFKKLRLTKYRKKKLRESEADFGAYQNAKSINDTTDAALSVWMEYRYAIMTLVYSLQDMHDVLLTLREVFKTTRKRKTYTAPDEWFYVPPGWALKENSVVVHDRVWIKRKYDPGMLLNDLLKQLQTNIFKTAWELIPLSFVVDWFINIGVLIDALTSHQPYIEDVQMYSRQAEGKILLEKEGTTVEIRVNTYHRFKLKESPISFFTLNNGMNLVRSIDAVALTWKPIRNKLSQIRKNLK